MAVRKLEEKVLRKKIETKTNKKWCSCKFPKGAGQVSGLPGAYLLMVLEEWMACRLPCTRVSLLRLTAGVTRLLAGPGTEDPRRNPCASAVRRIERRTMGRSRLWGGQERWSDVTSRAWSHGTSWAGTLGQQVHSAHTRSGSEGRSETKTQGPPSLP